MNGENYILVANNKVTSVLTEDERYLEEWPQFDSSVVAEKGYDLPLNRQPEGVSGWGQSTIADEELKKKFECLAENWKRETINTSSMQQMVLHPCYQEIIAMGPKVIPLILSELKCEPDFWFWALRVLAREDPVTEDVRGDLVAMTKAWLDWGSRHAYL